MSTYGTTTPQSDVAPSTTFDTHVADRNDQPGGEVAQQVREVSAEAKDHAKDVATTAADEAKSVTAEVKDHARDLVGQTRGRVREELSTQIGRFAGSVDGYADQLQTMASRADDPDDTVAQLVRQAGVRMHTMATRMQTRRPEVMLEDVKRFARRRPGVFVFGALGAGFVVGRFIRNVDRQALTDAVKGNGGGTDLPALTYESPYVPMTPSSPTTSTMVTGSPSRPTAAPMPSTSVPPRDDVVDLTTPIDDTGIAGNV